MISEGPQSRYCEEDLSKIENFYEAYNDKTQIWEIHHRLETDLGKTRQELIDANLYYSRPAKELIYLTKSEHVRLHNIGAKRSEELRAKMRKPHKKRCQSHSPSPSS